MLRVVGKLRPPSLTNKRQTFISSRREGSQRKDVGRSRRLPCKSSMPGEVAVVNLNRVKQSYNRLFFNWSSCRTCKAVLQAKHRKRAYSAFYLLNVDSCMRPCTRLRCCAPNRWQRPRGPCVSACCLIRPKRGWSTCGGWKTCLHHSQGACLSGSALALGRFQWPLLVSSCIGADPILFWPCTNPEIGRRWERADPRASMAGWSRWREALGRLRLVGIFLAE